jgi:hypothetical protein
MRIGDPTPITPTVNSAPVAPARTAVRQTGDGRAAERDRRAGARDDGQNFRATLDAALQRVAAQPVPKQPLQADLALETPRPEKRPLSTNIEIDGGESAQLYADRHNVVRGEEPYDGSAETSAARAQPYRSVTHHYAQSFFSTEGTFAARGDKLEIST